MVSHISALWTILLIGGIFVAVGMLHAVPVAADAVDTLPRIDVNDTEASLGLPPLVTTSAFDAEVAAENSRRIQAIMNHPAVGAHCQIHFPAGNYYFDGAAADWQATIETTAPYQKISGDGINVTRLFQHCQEVESTIRLKHTNVALERLFIGSTDVSDSFVPEWEAESERHQTAIHLDAPISDGRTWHTDPRIRQVAVNSYGNSILQSTYARPFEIAVKVTGSWLDVFVDEMWINDTATGIYIYQGAVMSGPAKFMRINQYSTHPPGRSSKLWTTFFKSEGHFMEQVELIHNTFIGAQFIYMEGEPIHDEDGTSPAYDMVIDHNYINVHDVGHASEADEPGPWNSGIYMNLPPKVHEDGSHGNYTRDIRFTNNSCTGRAPSRGAFFYMAGMCRGLTFSHNDISSPAIDKAIYIRATHRLEEDGVSRADDVAIRDVKITHNYFRSFRNIITVGGDAEDPERLARSVDSDYRGHDDDPGWIQRVVVAHNQNMMEGSSDTLGLTTCYLNRVRQGVVESNTFTETRGTALAINNSEEIAVTGNSFRGLNEDWGNHGIVVQNSDHVTLTGNVLSQFDTGLLLESSSQITLGNNVVRRVHTGLAAKDSHAVIANGNQISEAALGVDADSNTQLLLSGNMVDAEAGLNLNETTSDRDDIRLQGNIGIE